MKTFITILLLVNAISSKCQLNIGMRIGSNFKNFSKLNQDAYDYNSDMGFYGGLIFNHQINPEFELQSELNFSSEKAKKQEIQSIPSDVLNLPEANAGLPVYALIKASTVIHYLEIPFLAKLSIGNNVKYTMSFGPFVGLTLNAKRKHASNGIVYLDKAGTRILTQNPTSSSPLISSFRTEANMRNMIKDVNFGLMAGCGIHFDIGHGLVFVDYRLKLGLTAIDQRANTEGRHQLTTMSVTTGYMISL